MRRLPFHVLIFDTDDEPTSHCQFPTECAARKRYNKAIVSAECANVGRIQLTYIAHVMAEWVAFKEPEKPDVQTAGYVVYSARALNRLSNCGGSLNKTFHKTEDEAVAHARQLADKWSMGHEGLIVFKAIKHVQRVEWTPRPGTRIRVFDVE